MAQPADSIHIHNATERASVHAEILSVVFPSGLPTTIPSAIVARGRGPNTVIVVQGHSANHEDYNTGRFCDDLVAAGYTVIPVLMPGSGSTANHNIGNIPLSEFIRPVIEAVNWAEVNRSGSISVVGLSGGGWTTILAQALDDRIEVGVANAGWLPQYMWPSPTSGDWEQRLVDRMPPYTYLDLAILACSGSQPRFHLQILHEVDQCCFNRSWHDSGPAYVDEVNAVLDDLGAGQLDIHWQQQYLHEWSIPDRQDAMAYLRDEARPVRTIYDEGNRTGTWTLWTTTTPPGYAGDVYTATNNSGAECSWSQTDGGSVKLYATWLPHANRGDAVPYRIYTDGQLVGTVRISQRVAPRADYVASAGSSGTYNFQLLAAVFATAEVELRVGCDQANGYVVADAAMFEK